MHIFAQKQNQPQQPVSSSLARSKITSGSNHHTHTNRHLQRTIGNQAVRQLLQANAEYLKGGSATTISTPFAHDFSRIPVHPPAPIRIQPKLAVNIPGDIYEQEADRVSEQVMRMSEPQLHHACACGGACAKCQTEQRGKEHQRLQTKHVGSSDSGQTAAPPLVHEVLHSLGQPLDPATRAFMEPRFGYDFSKVRVHSGSVPEQSTRDISARAYTIGHNIVFGAAQFAPATQEGLRLIAHELTHVVQQSKLGRAPVSVQRFAEGEHKGIGDTATGHRTVFLAPDMPVTYGDIVALAGDYFGDLPTLISLVNKQGVTEGTRGEVWYALLVKIRANSEGRSEKEIEAEWLGKAFDEKAKAAVEERFKTLATKNIAHFPNPRKGDAARSQAVKGAGPSAIGGGATYRSNHATALIVAAAMGQASHSSPVPRARHSGTGKRMDDLNNALVIEAFADHFLTDAFSAGHQQTERASVKEYWDAKVPNFWKNFQRWLADSVTLELRKHPRTFASNVGAHMDPQWVAEQIALPSVKKAVASLPKLGFGDLVSGAIHDYFNKYGAQADVAGRRITLVGDSHLLTKAVPNSPLKSDHVRHITDKSQDTFAAATAAVKAGIEELFQARALGRQGEDPERVPDKILKHGGGLFAAEKLMPTLAPDATVADSRQKSPIWELESYEQVLADSRISEGLMISINEYANLVSESLSGLSREQMDAVTEVLIHRMKGDQSSVIKLLKEVITYTPLTSDVGFNLKHLKDLQEFRSESVLRN